MAHRNIVLGLGPTMRLYRYNSTDYIYHVNEGPTLVNFPVDDVVLMDKPDQFPPERTDAIWTNRYKNNFITYWPHNWKGKTRMLAVDMKPKGEEDWSRQIVPLGTNTPFIAAWIALQRANEGDTTVLYGVDFTQAHKHFRHKKHLVRAFADYEWLLHKYREKGCRLYLGSRKSKLRNIIPTI